VGSSLGLFALLVSLLILFPPGYKATAYIFLVRIQPVVTFDSRIKATARDEGDSQRTPSMDARRSGVIQLLGTEAIAGRVIETLGNQLKPEDRDVDRLSSKVEVKPVKNSDLIAISVRDRDPRYASLLASSWAKEAERFANNLFNTSRSEPFSALERELERARKEYESAQKEWESFLATTKLEIYKRRADSISQILDGVVGEYANLLTGMQKQTYEVLRNRLNEILSQAYNLTSLPSSQLFEEKVQVLSRLLGMKIQLELTLKTLRGFQEYVESTPVLDPLSTQYTLLLLKSQVFAGGSGSTQFQLSPANPPTMTRELARTEIQMMMQSLEDQLAKITIELESAKKELKTLRLPEEIFEVAPFLRQVLQLSGTLEKDLLSAGERVLKTDLWKRFESYLNQLKELQALIEAEDNRKKNLLMKRDLAWDSYSTILKKLEELRVSESLSTVEVKFASPAPLPTKRTPSPLLLGTLFFFLSLLFGLVGSVFYLMLTEPDLYSKLLNTLRGEVRKGDTLEVKRQAYIASGGGDS